MEGPSLFSPIPGKLILDHMIHSGAVCTFLHLNQYLAPSKLSTPPSGMPPMSSNLHSDPQLKPSYLLIMWLLERLSKAMDLYSVCGMHFSVQSAISILLPPNCFCIRKTLSLGDPCVHSCLNSSNKYSENACCVPTFFLSSGIQKTLCDLITHRLSLLAAVITNL